MSRSKTIDLLSPNIGARAPAGNKNQSRPRAGLAGFDYPQRHAFANIHLSLAYSGSGVRAAGDAYACNNPGDQKDNGPRKHFHREGYSRADHRQRVACGSTKNPGRINVAPHGSDNNCRVLSTHETLFRDYIRRSRLFPTIPRL